MWLSAGVDWNGLHLWILGLHFFRETYCPFRIEFMHIYIIAKYDNK